MAGLNTTRFMVNKKEKQFLDLHKAQERMSTAPNDESEEALNEMFDEFIGDQWGNDEFQTLRALEGIHNAYEDVTDHFLKRRFGQVDFSEWDGT